MKKWVCTILLAAFACILFTGCTEGLFSAKDYKEYIFDKDVITINISTTEEDWQYLMDNALSKPYINADVDIDGTVFKAVGLKTKGNSTLTSVVNSDSERYSLKLNFDKYADGQECYGLDSLVLNNVYSDPSYLKEYLSYELLDYMEVPSSLHTFAEIYVNGEYYGFFIAIEDVKDSYLQRNYGEAYTGEAYKPESLEMADEADIGFGIMDDIGNKFNDNFGRTEFNFTSFLTLVDSENNEIPWDTVLPENFNADTIASVTYGDGSVVDIDTMNFMMLDLNGIVSLTDENGISADLSGYTLKLPMNIPGMDGKAGFPGEQDNPSTMQPDNNGVIPENPIEGRGGMNGGTLGVDLVYTDDNPESYANIFDNAITKTDEEDETRLIETLKAISEGENLGEYIDIDEVLRYTAVNVFLTNLDSYLSNMGHNYCLYDEDGRLTILPWDYNLSFGTFGLGSSSEAVNYPIDTVFNGVDSSSRPIIGALIENQEYLEI
ncbi:MAG TPA: CotH kinase family protein, partial [Clostridia bacterium]|nr:CotH kinase family protein [Clostridia bacterium]